MSDFTWGIADRGVHPRRERTAILGAATWKIDDPPPTATRTSSPVSCQNHSGGWMNASGGRFVFRAREKATARLSCGDVRRNRFGNGGDVGIQNDSSASSAAARGNSAGLTRSRLEKKERRVRDETEGTKETRVPTRATRVEVTRTGCFE